LGLAYLIFFDNIEGTTLKIFLPSYRKPEACACL
jgi:hypothetical protein